VIGHSILTLLRRGMAYAPQLQAVQNAKRLDEVYIPSRYPNGLEDTVPGDFYTREDAEECIELAARVIGFVTKHAGNRTVFWLRRCGSSGFTARWRSEATPAVTCTSSATWIS
jgi:hypothetical protein